MNTKEVAFSVHRLGLSFPELLALHRALDTPENCIQRISTELLSQGFEIGFPHSIFSVGYPFLIKYGTEQVDRFEILPGHIRYSYNATFIGWSGHFENARLEWDRRQFIINGLDLHGIDCRNPKQLIKALLAL